MRGVWLMPLGFVLGCSGLPFEHCETPLPEHTPVESRFLHQDGADLVGGDGQRVTLRTVNLGGWLHWEAWIFGGPLKITALDEGSEGQILARVRELYGPDAEARFADRIRDGFVTERDFERIADTGFDSVRLPINHTLLDSEEGWAKLDQAIGWAEAHGLMVFIDMHAAPGGQAPLFTADPDATLLWDSPAAKDELVADWAAIAARYAESPAVAGYDLLNEPDPPDADALIALYGRVLEAVRAEDTEHLVVIEGTELSREFDPFTSRLDPNMAYGPHVYLWVGKPDAQWIASLAELSACHDVPVWVGEFGEDVLADIAGLRAGFEQDLDGWAIWTWKKVDTGGTPGLGEIEAPADWQELMASLGKRPGTAAVMDEDAAFAALDAFLAAAAEPPLDPEMLDALGL